MTQLGCGDRLTNSAQADWLLHESLNPSRPVSADLAVSSLNLSFPLFEIQPACVNESSGPKASKPHLTKGGGSSRWAKGYNILSPR